MRYTLALILFFLANSSFSADKETTGSINKLEGCYIDNPHRIYAIDSDKKFETVYNYLKISKNFEDKWQVTAFVGGNHVCNISGTVEETGNVNTLEVTPDKEVLEQWESDPPQCQLHLKITNTILQLDEPDKSSCNQLFLCGAGVDFTRYVFHRKNKIQLNDKRCEP
jgi:hypothetical protein